MIEKIYCPNCGKFLLRADASKSSTLYPWCKSCKKEVEIKIESQISEKEKCQRENLVVSFGRGTPNKIWCKMRKAGMSITDEANDPFPVCAYCPYY